MFFCIIPKKLLNIKVTVRKIYIFILFTFFLSAKEIESTTPLYTPVINIDETPETLHNRIWNKDREKLTLNKNNLAFWIKFQVQNRETHANDALYLMFQREFIYRLVYFLEQNNQLLSQQIVGYHQRQENPPFIAPEYIFSLNPSNIKKNQPYTVYLKIQSLNLAPIEFSILTKDEINQIHHNKYILQAIFLGAMLMIMLYNLSLFLITKFSPYRYYLIYMFSITIYFAIYQGYLKAYESIPILYINIIFLVFVLFAFVSMGQFLQKLFNYKELFPTMNRLIILNQYYLIINIFFYITFTLMDEFKLVHITFRLFPIFLPIYYILYLITLFKVFHTYRVFIAKWYFLSWLFIGFMVLVQAASNNTLITFPIESTIVLEVSMLLESLLLSIFLALRIKAIETEKNQQRTLLIQKNRLSAIGEMASSIAHQWRQPLSTINGVVLNLEIDHRKNILDGKQLEKHLVQIETVTAHLSSTINSFLDFSAAQKERERFYVEEIIRQCEKITNLTFKYRANKTKIYGYKAEFLQALLITINNAHDAAKLNKVEPFIKIDLFIQNEMLYLYIEDNGGGIKEEIRDKVFDPYFTTKHQSQGTGLGLYILKIIIQDKMLGNIKLSNTKQGLSLQLTIPHNLGLTNDFGRSY